MARDFRKILCVDFDGVIHSYSSGWLGAVTIRDRPVDGAFAWLKSLAFDNRFEVCIYSARSSQEGGVYAMKQWFLEHGFDREAFTQLQFPTQKPPAWITIDDRAICFKGAFPSTESILNFRPWYRQPTVDADERVSDLLASYAEALRELDDARLRARTEGRQDCDKAEHWGQRLLDAEAAIRDAVEGR